MVKIGQAVAAEKNIDLLIKTIAEETKDALKALKEVEDIIVLKTKGYDFNQINFCYKIFKFQQILTII